MELRDILARACLAVAVATSAAHLPRAWAAPPSGDRAGQHGTEASKAAAPYAADSLYHLHPKLTDDRGRSVGLDVFAGQPVLVAMFYASCTSMCPMLFAELKRIDAALSPAARARTRVLLVSFDSVRDTPESLARLAARLEVDRERYRFVRADADDVRAIAALLGVRYRLLPNGEVAHSSVITALDGGGRPIARLEGLGNDAAALLSALEAAR